MTPWRLCLMILLCLLCMQVRAEGLLVIKPRDTELTRTFIATLQEQHRSWRCSAGRSTSCRI